MLSRILALVLSLAPAVSLAQGVVAPMRLPRGSTGPADALSVGPPGSAARTIGSMLRPRPDGSFEFTPDTLPRIGCVPIETYGGAGDGKTDNLPAMQRAADPANGRIPLGAVDRGFCVALGGGDYYFSAPWSYSYPSSNRSPNDAPYAVAIRGAGSSATNLIFGGTGGGIALTLNGHKHTAHFDGLQFITSSAGGGSGLKITQNNCLLDFGQSTFGDLTFRGLNSAGPAFNAWNIDAEIIGLSGTSWTGMTFYGDSTWANGVGLSFKGNPNITSGCPHEFNYSIYHNVDHSVFNQHGVGLLLDDWVQGVTVSSSNFQNGRRGIYQPPGMTAAANVQLNVTNTQFQVATAQVDIQSGFNILQMSNNTVLVGPNTDTVGFRIKNTALATITGNVFNSVVEGNPRPSNGGSAIEFNGSASTFSGNTFSGLVTGLNLQAGSINNTVGANQYQFTTTPYINAGTHNTFPIMRGSQSFNITSCNPVGFFVPHNLPGRPDPSQVTVGVSLPSTGAASLDAPVAFVAATFPDSVLVTFSCAQLGAAGNVTLTVSSSLSN